MKALILALWIGGCGADSVSTHYGLAHGGRELMLTQNPWANHVIIGGQTAFGAWGSIKYFERHPKIALAVSIGVASWRGYVAYRNFQQIGGR